MFEGKRELADENRYLGRLVLSPPAGRIISYIVSFEVDTNGVLAVHAKDPGTGDESHEVFERCARFVCSQQEIARLKEGAKAFKEADMLQIKRHDTRNNLLATCLFSTTCSATRI